MAERREEPEAATEQALDQAGPAAVSLALGRTSKGGKALDAEATAFLRDQRRLINLQTEHLHEQRELILSRLRWGRLGDRIRVVLQLMTALVGLAVIVALGWMAWTASRQHGMAIEPFTVPAELAQRGYDSQALASRFLDRLGQLEDQSYSVRTPLGFHGAEQRQLKLVIPETGISLGEVQGLFDQWLGHEIHVEGQVETSGDALTLAVRNGDQPLITVSGPAADVDALVDQTADQAFAQSQPYRYARYLQLAGRNPEALARYETLALSGDAEDRDWAMEAWGAAIARQGDVRAGVAKEYAGATTAPGFPLFWANSVGMEEDLGHNEAALRAAVRGEAATESGRSSHLGPDARRYMDIAIRGLHAELIGDYRRAATEGAAEDALWPTVEHLPISSWLVHELQDQAELSASAHDAAAAEAMVANIGDSQSLLGAQSPESHGRIEAELEVASGLVAAARYDWLTAWRENAAALKSVDGRAAMILTARATEDAALAGHPTEAQALASSLPADCYPCARARAEIAAANRDIAGADRAFAEAVRLAPSIPFADVEWGRVRLANGDAAGATAHATQAMKLSPHYADAAELWGEALIRAGDFAGAGAKFAMADEDAPHWGRNHMLWGESLMLSGRYAEARRQYEAANGLDLSRPDRAALDVLLARTARGPLHG